MTDTSTDCPVCASGSCNTHSAVKNDTPHSLSEMPTTKTSGGYVVDKTSGIYEFSDKRVSQR